MAFFGGLWAFWGVSASIFRFSGAFCVDCALFRPKRPLGPDVGPKQNFKKLFVTVLAEILTLIGLFWGFWGVFSDSLALSASIALFFVPKDPLGPDFGPKQNFKLFTFLASPEPPQNEQLFFV